MTAGVMIAVVVETTVIAVVLAVAIHGDWRWNGVIADGVEPSCLAGALWQLFAKLEGLYPVYEKHRAHRETLPLL